MKNKFGTFKGVFVPSTEAILGTILFLLLPALTADVGLYAMIAIAVLAHTVTVSTSFSIADCATNLNTIGGGGMYALSKKSLGKAFGGSIGIQLFIAQAASIGFYSIGFAEPLQPIFSVFLKNISFFADNSVGGILLQKQIIASIFFLLFFIIVMVGADFTLKLQTLILLILGGSVLVIFLSPFIGINIESGGKLFVKSFGELNTNGARAITIGIFFMTFTQFFPAVTGIDAGIGMSGELKNPRKSLVQGTFATIAVTFVIYIISIIIFSMMKKGSVISGYSGGDATGPLLTNLLGFGRPFPENIPGVLILVGILFATGSSALSCFMTAPRTLQSLAIDGILPGFLKFLKKDFRKGGTEPRFAALITFVIGFSIIWMGSINTAATIVGICFLVVYGWVNGAAFFEHMSNNPSFRPTFRGNAFISLYGFLACIIVIMLYSPVSGIVILVVQYIIFLLILKYKAQGKLEGVWWGLLFTIIKKSLLSFNNLVQGTKNWRPILSAIAVHSENSNPQKIDKLGNLIASFNGLVNLNIISKDEKTEVNLDYSAYNMKPGFITSKDITETILTIIQKRNPGDISQNTLLMEHLPQVDNIRIMKQCLSSGMNILLMKNAQRFRGYRSIDIWWRGEKNGNLMVLLAYIMKITLHQNGEEIDKIRIIRKLGPGEDSLKAENEIKDLLSRARLTGEIIILSHDDIPFIEILKNHSQNVDLIMLGLPGNYTEPTEKGIRSIFNLDELFFDREIENYKDLPAVLFVKSQRVIDLIED